MGSLQDSGGKWLEKTQLLLSKPADRIKWGKKKKKSYNIDFVYKIGLSHTELLSLFQGLKSMPVQVALYQFHIAELSLC